MQLYRLADPLLVLADEASVPLLWRFALDSLLVRDEASVPLLWRFALLSLDSLPVRDGAGCSPCLHCRQPRRVWEALHQVVVSLLRPE